MPIIIVIAVLTAMKLFDVSYVANVSWWWVVGLGGVAFIWFEFIERLLGLDKRKENLETAKAKKERIRKAFEKK
jgi:small Trp-rich protein